MKPSAVFVDRPLAAGEAPCVICGSEASQLLGGFSLCDVHAALMAVEWDYDALLLLEDALEEGLSTPAQYRSWGFDAKRVWGEQWIRVEIVKLGAKRVFIRHSNGRGQWCEPRNLKPVSERRIAEVK